MKTRKTAKTAVVAFKVEKELADILNQLPKKRAFIRKAIVAQLDMACPLCRGLGLLPKGLHDHFEPLLAQLSHRHCEGCGTDESIPTADPGDLAAEARSRLEQFFHGGPFLCQPCYVKAPPCGECGWHITPDQTKKHHRQAHDD